MHTQKYARQHAENLCVDTCRNAYVAQVANF